MKKIIFPSLFLCILSISMSLAQPSDAVIKSDLKQRHASAIAIDITGAGATKKVLENNTLQTIHSRSVKLTFPSQNSKFPNTKVALYGGVTYTLNGGGFVFKQFSMSTQEIMGMPKPNKEEVLAFLNKNILEVFRTSKSEIVGKPSAIDLPTNTAYTWDSYDNVSFNVESTYEILINNIGDAETVKQPYEIRLYGKDGGNWEKMNASKASEGKAVLSKKKYTRPELENIETFQMILDREESDKKWASLPKLTIPEFKDMYGVMEFVHQIFMEANALKTESLLYNMLSSSHFRKPDFRVPSRDGSELIPSVIGKVATGDFLYKDQFCPMPEIKETGTGYIDYWNKDKSSYARISVGTENGKWKLGGVGIYIISNPEKAKALTALPCTKTSLSAIERGERESIATLKPNSLVLAFYESDGLWYPAFYKSYANYYFDVQYLIDNSKGKVRKVIPFSPQVGDKALVKLQSGNLQEITIKSVNNYDLVIDFNGKDTPYKVSGLLFKK